MSQYPNRDMLLQPEAIEARIHRVEVQTAVLFPVMKTFYHQQDGMAVLDETARRITFAAGQTQLTFPHVETRDEPSFYHIALNIPGKKILAASAWLGDRTPLIPVPDNLQDPAYPGNVVNYRHWHAHAIFCFDPAGSIVDLIIRHGLLNTAPGDFTSADILYVSEVALVVDDGVEAAHGLCKTYGLAPYTVASEFFAALGDENGLQIVMKRGRLIILAATVQKAVGVLLTHVILRGSHHASDQYLGYPYRIDIEI